MPDRGPRGPGSIGGEAGGKERLGYLHGACQLGFDGRAQTKWKPSIKHQTVLWAAEAHRLFISGARAPTLTAGRGRRSCRSESLAKVDRPERFLYENLSCFGYNILILILRCADTDFCQLFSEQKGPPTSFTEHPRGLCRPRSSQPVCGLGPGWRRTWARPGAGSAPRLPVGL